MITIELPITLSEPQTRFAAPRKLQQSGKQLMLRGLHVSIETEGRIYEISTEQSPLRGLISSRGIA
jgi:hypothetical protein